ncbi:MAG: peptidase C11 [Lachnospiraceae bacterium]|nr:peptidase C11 [Lachnospiraceae bacterium]
MDKNRPTSREKHVTGGGGNVQKRGSGLGTGPVGNVQSHSNSGSGGHTQLSGGGSGRRAGTRAGGMGLGGVALLIIFFLVKSFLGGGGGSTTSSDIYDMTGTSTVNESYTTGSSASQNTAADMTVAAGAREKRTKIIGGGADKITIMVYMCGTDLESRSGMATNDLNEMLQASMSDNINLIVYTGGCKAWKNNVVNSGVNQIYRIQNGKFVCLEDNMGNKPMVDPATLTEFINYCKKNYPADRNDLIFWDHGGGSLSGYGYDEKNASMGSMTLDGIDTALSNAGMTFDFIGFDACLMATVENGLMLDKYADYMIASEETEPGVGWYYTNWLTKLSQNTSMPTVEIGKNIVDDFIDVCNQKCRGQKTTLSVVDLAELSATVPDELTAFAKSTGDIIKNKDYKTVSNARSKTREFAQSSKIDQIDLVHFCNNLGTDEAKELSEAVLGAVKYNRTASNMTDSNGLSIYFPYKKTSKVRNALSIFNRIGMNSEYSKCIQEFSAVEVTGQAAAGGSSDMSNPLGSLLGSGVGSGSTSGATGADSDAISSLLGSLMGGGSSSSSMGFDSSVLDLFMGRDMSDQDTADYVADNYFDPNNLTWKNDGGSRKIDLSEDQWDLVQDIELNVFYDDGEGYVDLGMDNVFEFDDNGALIGDYDNTWLAIDGQVVPYYHTSTVDYTDGYSISGYVPCFLNGTRAELILIFDTDNPSGIIAGARYVYTESETDTIAKNMTEVKAGDKLDFICDYYTYDGEYSDSYMLGEQMTLSADPEISNVDVGSGATRVTYRFTDIYNQYYWTPVLPQ